jgi:surface protein
LQPAKNKQMKTLLRTLLIILIVLTIAGCEDPIEPTVTENGIIKVPSNAKPGDTYTIDGDVYTVVNEYMLREMVANNEDVTKVITSLVTDMHGMFTGDTDFNQDISHWDVSNVTDMYDMFAGVSSFNQPLDSWEVNKVESMNGMFQDAISFNQPLGSWDVSKVLVMGFVRAHVNGYNGGMFNGATSFNQDLSAWSVSNVTECDGFSTDATSWTLPKPNFTNCDPGG